MLDLLIGLMLSLLMVTVVIFQLEFLIGPCIGIKYPHITSVAILLHFIVSNTPIYM